MANTLTLENDPLGQIDRGGEQIFRGRDQNDALVRLHMAADEWAVVFASHSSRDSALHALERLSKGAEWLRNEVGGGWTVRLVLPKS